MKQSLLLLLVVLLCLCAVAVAQKSGEEVEPYLVTPITQGHHASFTLDDKSMVSGKVVGGTDQTVIVADESGKRSEIPVTRVRALQFQRPRRSTKLDFLGSVIGSVSLGFAGAAIGRTAAEHIHSDHTAGTAGPMIGGLTFGFLGGYLGQKIIRHAVKEDVRLTVPAEAPPVPAQSRLTPPPLSVPELTGHR